VNAVVKEKVSQQLRGRKLSLSGVKNDGKAKMAKNLNKIKVIGDRVLIYPDSGQDRTSSGLYLPPTVTEKESVQGG